MNKKTALTFVFLLVTITPAFCFLFKSKALGNIHHHFTEPTTNISSFSFSSEINDRIKITFKSNKKSNNLTVTLYDSDMNTIYELDQARELETYITLEKTDVYTLEAACTNYLGTYEVNIYPANRGLSQ